MKSIKEDFDEYIQGSNELYWWKTSLENDWESGKKINKRKYQKICNLYEERRQRARELCPVGRFMPPHFPPPPPPKK